MRPTLPILSKRELSITAVNCCLFEDLAHGQLVGDSTIAATALSSAPSISQGLSIDAKKVGSQGAGHARSGVQAIGGRYERKPDQTMYPKM